MTLARILGAALGGAAGLLAAAAGLVYARSERRIARPYAAPVAALAVPHDEAAVARGRHLASIATCVLCHGRDLGGAVYSSDALLGTIAGPNLTRGRGGVGAALTTADWVRAVRHGVGRDGRSLIVMPSEVYVRLGASDLAALVAYGQQLPPVDRVIPRSRFGPLGRGLLAAGKLNILVAEKTPALPLRAAPPPAPTADYGRYLADVTGCHGCHGFGLSGGRVAGPPSFPPAANLTPAGPLARWGEGDFARALRQGRRPDNSAIHPFMPWREYAAMSDEEVRALWLYVRGVRGRATGTK
jgi:mono/diheme cytochrome c family protein